MSIERNIIIKSIQLTLGINVINIILSLILSNAYFGGIDINNIKGIIGNITFLESAILLLYGASDAYSHTPKLRFDPKDENNPVLVRLQTGIKVVQTKRHMTVEDYRDPSTQGKPFISLLCGAFLLAEIIILAILTV